MTPFIGQQTTVVNAVQDLLSTELRGNGSFFDEKKELIFHRNISEGERSFEFHSATIQISIRGTTFVENLLEKMFTPLFEKLAPLRINSIYLKVVYYKFIQML
jgi:hypothetical protein